MANQFKVRLSSGRSASVVNHAALSPAQVLESGEPIDYLRWVRDLFASAYRDVISPQHRPLMNPNVRGGSCGSPTRTPTSAVAFLRAEDEFSLDTVVWAPLRSARSEADLLEEALRADPGPAQMSKGYKDGYEDGLGVKTYVIAGRGDAAPRQLENQPWDIEVMTWDYLYDLAVKRFNEPSNPMTVAAYSTQAAARSILQALLARPEALTEVDHRQFEQLVAVLLSDIGFDVVDLTQNGPDGGYDIVVSRFDSAKQADEIILFECKHWVSGRRVSVDIAASLQEIRLREKADRAVLVSSSGYTTRLLEMRSQIQSGGVYLRDRADIERWVRAWERTYAAPHRYRLNPSDLVLGAGQSL